MRRMNRWVSRQPLISISCVSCPDLSSVSAQRTERPTFTTVRARCWNLLSGQSGFKGGYTRFLRPSKHLYYNVENSGLYPIFGSENLKKSFCKGLQKAVETLKSIIEHGRNSTHA